MKKILLLILPVLITQWSIAQKPTIAPDSRIEAKIDTWISKLTLEEKIGQMTLLEINMVASRDRSLGIQELMKMPKPDLA